MAAGKVTKHTKLRDSREDGEEEQQQQEEGEEEAARTGRRKQSSINRSVPIRLLSAREDHDEIELTDPTAGKTSTGRDVEVEEGGRRGDVAIGGRTVDTDDDDEEEEVAEPSSASLHRTDRASAPSVPDAALSDQDEDNVEPVRKPMRPAASRAVILDLD